MNRNTFKEFLWRNKLFELTSQDHREPDTTELNYSNKEGLNAKIFLDADGAYTKYIYSQKGDVLDEEYTNT